jgi:hypothetical protein
VASAELREDLVVLGEAAGLLLREEHASVQDDVELSSATGRYGRGDTSPLLDLGRETRGP